VLTWHPGRRSRHLRAGAPDERREGGTTHDHEASALMSAILLGVVAL
jgi:hypothetical protein